MTANLEDLRAFAAVYETGGFGTAARRLSLSTNAVSLRIRKLEESLGIRLFVRTTRKVSPTDEARTYYERVALALQELDYAEEILRSDTESLRGDLRISIPAALATRPFLRRVHDLLDANPLLRFNVAVSNRPADIVTSGSDVTVVVGQLADSAFIGRLLGRVKWVLAATPGYLDRHGRPRSAADLSSHRCLRLLTSPPQDEWTLIDRRGREVRVPVGGSFCADDSRTLGDAVYAGLGIGLRPAGECAAAVQERRLERVLPTLHFQTLEIHALVPKGRIRVPRVAACIELLRDALTEIA